MINLKGGYGGTLLYVDLTKGKIEKKPLDIEIIEKYIGGLGLASKILFDSIPAKCDPLGEDNVLMFVAGPLTGTLFPQASRYTVAAKSPLTEMWGEAHAGGHFGPELKLAGYDGIILNGKSEKPVYLYINDEEVELVDASHIWGMQLFEAIDKVVDERKDSKLECAAIGPAGENKVRFASIITRNGRVAARSGIGAVMGSKNLKLVAVRGTKGLDVAYPGEYLSAVKEWYDKVLNHPFTEGRIKYGTSGLVDLMQTISRFPTYNMKQGVFDEWENLGSESYHEKYFLRPRADYACIQRCGRFVCVPSGPYKNIGKGPEYECLSALGSRCGNSRLDSVIYAHHLCDEYGMDTISTGATISWAFECFENGLLTKDDTDGIDLTWGNYETVVKLVEKIGKREGFGDLLAEGSYRAAQKVGKGADKFVMHVKKQEIASQEPRAQKSMGLASAVASRGADHLFAFPVLDEGSSFHKEIKEWYGEKYLPEIGDRLNYKYKGVMVKHNEDYSVIIESLGVCKYGTMVPPALYYPDIVKSMKITFGWETTEKELKTIGERIVNLHRLFNLKQGFKVSDDSLPERFIKEPAPFGMSKGQVVELDKMLEEYYKERDWDIRTGIPSKEKLSSLGLEKEGKIV